MLLWIIAILTAYVLKGICGFGSTLVVSSILSFSQNNAAIAPVELLLGVPSNLIQAFRGRKHLRWRFFLPICLLVMAGSVPGVLFLKNTDASIVKIVFGCVIVLIGVDMLVKEIHAVKLGGSKLLLGAIGIVAGLLCGLYGIGVLVTAYMSRVTDNMDEFKANIAVVFATDNVFRIILYTCFDLLTLEVAKQAAMLLPFMVVGLLAGMFIGKKMNARIARLAVIVMLIISGVVLVAKEIMAR